MLITGVDESRHPGMTQVGMESGSEARRSCDADPKIVYVLPASVNAVAAGRLVVSAIMTSTIDPSQLPTEEDAAFYRTHGYWISPPILPGQLLDMAERGMARLYAGDIDRPLPDGRRRQGWTPEHGDILRKNDYSSLLVDELARLVRYPLIAACAARLVGVDEIRLWHDQLLYKPVDRPDDRARGANVGWHTDRQYWMTCSSQDMLTAWVPFHDVDAAGGAITFVEGSHRWEAGDGLDFFDQDLSTLDWLREDQEVELVPAEVHRRAITFHHCRTIHGSGPNHSTAPRRSIAIHLQPGDNHFVQHTIPGGRVSSHGNDILVRRTAEGTPDYADPTVCPVLWSR
jgi:hypothetical protein